LSTKGEVRENCSCCSLSCLVVLSIMVPTVIDGMVGVLLVEDGRELTLVCEMIMGASRGNRGCLYVLICGTTATPREGEFMGDSSSIGTEGEEDGEDGGDIEELLSLRSLRDEGEEHSPSGFDTLRFTFALLF